MSTVALTGLPEALKQLSTNIVYVHVDLDVIDTSEGRANGWACDGGLSVNQLLDALELIGRSASIVAGAVTCYDQLSILTIAWSGDSWHRGVACALGKPPRYQTLIERSITARGFGTEKCYAIAACMTTRDSCRRLLTLNIECLAQIAMPTSSYIRTTRAHSGL